MGQLAADFGDFDDPVDSGPPLATRSVKNERGIRCEGHAERGPRYRAVDHEACPGWFPTIGDVGWCCGCPCHELHQRWPAWQEHQHQIHSAS